MEHPPEMLALCKLHVNEHGGCVHLQAFQQARCDCQEDAKSTAGNGGMMLQEIATLSFCMDRMTSSAKKLTLTFK